MTSQKVPASRRKTRLGGATSLQRSQRAETRRRILDAAESVFFEHSYAGTTIDAIVSRAGVSRASFYRAFTGKWEVARALFDDAMPEFAKAWRMLADAQNPDAGEIARLLNAVLDIVIQKRELVALMREVQGIERESRSAIFRTHEANIKLLGAGITAFRLAAEGSTGTSLTVRAHLLLIYFDELCYLAAAKDAWPFDLQDAITAYSKDFYRFISEFPE